MSAARLIKPVDFTSVAEAIELAWHVREGLLGLVGKNRPEEARRSSPRTYVFRRIVWRKVRTTYRNYLPSMGSCPVSRDTQLTGTAFISLSSRISVAPTDCPRYSAFMTELVDLVVRKYDGSLKAEHGTGRNMAPFLASEWGEKATAMMWRISKQPFADPQGILAPDVILTRNPKLHLENPEVLPANRRELRSSLTMHRVRILPEPVCPSRNVTMTPRQRIALRREMTRQKADSAMLAQLQREYQYDGIETCAGDGTCAIPCPIGINTGALIKEFRALENSPTAEAVALRLAQNWKAVERLSRASLWGAHVFSSVFGVKPLTALTAAARSVVSPDLVPAVPGPMPRAASGLPTKLNRDGAAAAVYFCAWPSTACSAAILPGRPLPRLRKPLSGCPNALVSRCGFRRMLLACVARPRGNRKPTRRGTSTWREPLPMRCGAGAMEELFPS